MLTSFFRQYKPHRKINPDESVKVRLHRGFGEHQGSPCNPIHRKSSRHPAMVQHQLDRFWQDYGKGEPFHNDWKEFLGDSYG